MTALMGIRVLSGSGAPWGGWRRRTASTTVRGRGQDKSTHIARRSGRCFCWGFLRAAHLVARRGKVRTLLKLFSINGFPHIARRRHG